MRVTQDSRHSDAIETDNAPGLDPEVPARAGHREKDRRAGRVMVGIGVLGVLLALAAVAVGLILISSTDDTLTSSLDVTAEAVVLAEDTVDIAAESLAVAATSLEQVEATTGTSVGTFIKIEQAFEDAAVIVGTDVPETLEAVRRTTPILIDTAELLTSTLGALSFLGVEVPAQEPAAALVEVDQELTELSGSLTEEGARLADIASDFGQFSEDAGVIAAGMDDARSSLDRVSGIVDGYRTTSSDAVEVINRARSDLNGQLTLARVLVVLLGLIVIAGQAVPIYLGRRLLDGTADSTVVGATAGTGVGRS
ncbi:MAG: hypothetical protein KJO17_00855 [Acidimicrobiia bacterium]|nr:hypothetical protein [Acidimicrobiia bacterium]